MKKSILFLLALLFLLQVTASHLQAIPAFARKYRMSCKTCHTPFPKLKDYGDEFAGNGFVIADKDAPRYYVDTGDDFLSLLREMPIALRLEGYLTYNNANTSQVDFTSPYLLKLLSGGELAKNFAYYFYFYVSERGEVAGIEDAFLMFNNLFSTPLDFYIGQFQVSDPLFKRELRLSLEDYQIFRTRVGQSRINLAYDRGIMLTYGLPSGTDMALEVLNGTGIGEANPFRNFDFDKYKNFVFRISQDVSNSFRVGGFGYSGKEEQQNTLNKLWMLAADATVNFEQFELNFQFVRRSDSNPNFLRFPQEIKTSGGFAELIYLPAGDDSKWYALGLLNWIASDQKNLEYSSATLHYGRMLRRNIRLIAELNYFFEGPYEDHARLALGFVTGF